VGRSATGPPGRKEKGRVADGATRSLPGEPVPAGGTVCGLAAPPRQASPPRTRDRRDS
jgi:hypothetical protein